MFDLQTAIDNAHHVTFMTGAGVSTHSGIPDYRSKGGLYANSGDPEYLLSADNLRDHPASFYDFVKTRMYYPDAKPNVIHEKMAAITNKKGTIVTQNVDGLDTKAGAHHVVQFHGTLYQVHCQKCGKQVPWQDYLKDMHHQEDGGILRPDIVLYGEGINQDTLIAAVQAVQSADLIVVVGTSFRVYPFAGLIQYAQPSATLVAVNKENIAAGGDIHMIQADALTVFEKLQA
ncbi:NAD-dependent protein deacylase [Schleiferilactobacillus perolens]|jgi:NAD-dependent deacetylase|uniref:NAD-dependent protein deacylase n=1 Tax=Schleiferilactobacillus perolens TaxID=100468 RepID=UPI00235720AD|nr:NAD-dependent protein deacylase [Schleiferilactobacillus perolens]MCI2172466.1 NAD-dependent protein deacylase [Schleiferilactobacillus perolens]